MINRVLIRIKVVQMLYSYLLTEKVFSLETQPTPPTKASRLAYALYLDMLALMTLIADEVTRPGGQHPLADNRFIRAVRSDEKIRSVLAKNRVEPTPVLAPAIVAELANVVKESAPCRAYIKEGSVDMAGDLRLWRELFNSVIMTSAPLNAAIETLPGYSLRAMDIMRNLMEETFSNFSSTLMMPCAPCATASTWLASYTCACSSFPSNSRNSRLAILKRPATNTLSPTMTSTPTCAS